MASLNPLWLGCAKRCTRKKLALFEGIRFADGHAAAPRPRRLHVLLDAVSGIETAFLTDPHDFELSENAIAGRRVMAADVLAWIGERLG